MLLFLRAACMKGRQSLWMTFCLLVSSLWVANRVTIGTSVMHNDRVTATGLQKIKSHYCTHSLLLNNAFLSIYPSFSCCTPSSRLFSIWLVCCAVHLSLWGGSRLLSKHCLLQFSGEPTCFAQYPPRVFVVTAQKKTKQNCILSTQIVLSLVPVLPHSLSLWFICMRDSGEYLTATAGQWTGALLCVCECVLFAIVHVHVRQRDEEGAVGS